MNVNILALPSGTELNHYVIETVLGQGGFGVVYKAHHAHLNEQVVIKEFLPVELAGRQGTTVTPHATSKQDVYSDCLRRFMEEGRTLVKLRHPNVVRCRDLFTANGTAYLVMDFEDGLPLDELLRELEAQGQRYTEQQLLHFLIPLAEGLDYIHQQGVLHRDIKPANVFIRRSDGSPVIIDFGAAKQNFALASQSQAPFTEFYAPLEQIEGGGEAKPTLDVYAFGGLMYRLVTGQIGPKAEARAMALVYGKADPLPNAASLALSHYSEGLYQIIARCLEFKPDDRWQTMSQVKQQLQQLNKPRSAAAELLAVQAAAQAASQAQYASVNTAAEVPFVAVQPAGETKPVNAGSGMMKKLMVSTAVILVLGLGVWQYDQYLQNARQLEAQQKQDQSSWQLAQKLASESSYQMYLQQYPQGRYRVQAQQMIDKLQKEAEMQKAEAERQAVLAADAKAKQEAADRDKQLAAAVAKAKRDAEQKARRALELAGDMVTIPAGSFTMGCSSDDSDCSDNEKPAHKVTLASFRLAKYELTRDKFAAFVNATSYKTDAEKNAGGYTGCFSVQANRTPSWDWTEGVNWRNADLYGDAQTGQHPVVCVSVNDVQAYINWLNKQTGMTFRLPSEAEWEYAARAGSASKYFFSGGLTKVCDFANISDLGKMKNGNVWTTKVDCNDGYAYTSPVGHYQSNKFGLYDMIGNVREMTADCWNASFNNAPGNGDAWLSGNCDVRVLRGGAFGYGEQDVRVSKRVTGAVARREHYLGFRLAQSIED